MACRDSINVVEEPEIVPQPLGGGREQVRPSQDVPMTAGATDAIVATATPSPIQAGAIVSRRRFQKGNIIIRGKTPRRYGMYREDVLQPNGTFKECDGVSCLARSAACQNVRHGKPSSRILTA
jgi:hypothetical protein